MGAHAQGAASSLGMAPAWARGARSRASSWTTMHGGGAGPSGSPLPRCCISSCSYQFAAATQKLEICLCPSRVCAATLVGSIVRQRRHQGVLPACNSIVVFHALHSCQLHAAKCYVQACLGNIRNRWLPDQDLYHDATRDLRALGCHISIINNCQMLDRETRVGGLAKDCQEGVLFMCALFFGTPLFAAFLLHALASQADSGLHQKKFCCAFSPSPSIGLSALARVGGLSCDEQVHAR